MVSRQHSIGRNIIRFQGWLNFKVVVMEGGGAKIDLLFSVRAMGQIYFQFEE